MSGYHDGSRDEVPATTDDAIDKVEAIQCELWLRNWSETSNGGANVSFTVHAEDLEPFKRLTLAKGRGKSAVAGQRFSAVLVLVADDETPEKLPMGPLCKQAAIWCKETSFQLFLAGEHPDLWLDHSMTNSELKEWRRTHPAEPDGERQESHAKAVLCQYLGIESRKEIDHNALARRAYTDIQRAYAAYLREKR